MFLGHFYVTFGLEIAWTNMTGETKPWYHAPHQETIIESKICWTAAQRDTTELQWYGSGYHGYLAKHGPVIGHVTMVTLLSMVLL